MKFTSNTDGKAPTIPEDKLLLFSIEDSITSIFWIGRDGAIVYANKTALRTLGYTQQELTSLGVYDIDPHFNKSTWNDHWNHIKKVGSKVIESEHRAKSGHLFPVEISISFLHVDNEEFHCVFVRDITEQKEIEKLLRESEERFRVTLDVTSNGMWDRNLVTGKTYYGANWASSLGYNETDLLNKKITWQGLLHPEDKSKTLQTVQDHIDGKTERYISEFRLLNSDGKYQWILAKGKVVEFDNQGNPTRFVGTQTNITERKIAEEAVKEQAEKIRRFAFSIAHDLKNPAVAIRGFAERLCKNRSTLSKEQLSRYSEQILTSTRQIEELVEKINIFISAKEAPLSIENINLQEVLQTLICEFTEKLKNNEVVLTCSIPQVIIHADRIALLRVLRNLIDNALKYGGKKLHNIRIHYTENQSHHILSVEDDGVGLHPDELESVYDAFERKSTSAGIGGTGLGLAIVREIARQHRGKVWTENKENSGVIFSCSFARNLKHRCK